MYSDKHKLKYSLVCYIVIVSLVWASLLCSVFVLLVIKNLFYCYELLFSQINVSCIERHRGSFQVGTHVG